MSKNSIAKANDFRRAVERLNVEQVVLPACGLPVLLCRPPVFAALTMAREGTQLQARVTDAKPEEVKSADIEAFTQWLTGTLTRLFLEPRFTAAPTAEEIGLGDILIDDLKFIFRWLRGEVFTAVKSGQETVDSSGSTRYPLSTNNCSEDLARFSGGQGAAAVPGGGGEAQPLPSERAVGAHRHASLSAGLQRG
jgi:hypothetical protein